MSGQWETVVVKIEPLEQNDYTNEDIPENLQHQETIVHSDYKANPTSFLDNVRETIVKIESQQNHNLKQEPSDYTNEDITENIQHQETIEHSENITSASFLDNVNREKGTHQEVDVHHQTGEYSGNNPLNLDGEVTSEVNKDSVEEYEELESIDMLEPQIEITETMTAEIEARSYQDGAEYVCRQCERRFARKYALIVHLKANTCNIMKLAKCRYCCKDYNIKYITAHERTHTGELQTGELQYRCNTCTKTFARSSSLAQHRTWCLTQQLKLICKVCNKTFTRNHNLKLHEKSHMESNDIHRLPCDECDKTFPSNSSLKRHKQTHNREVWYRCDVCNKPFSRESYLSKHKLIHTGEKPFPCDSCDLMFRFSHALTRHKKRVHMPKSETLEVTEDLDEELKYDDSLENVPSCSSETKSELSAEIKTDPNEITINCNN